MKNRNSNPAKEFNYTPIHISSRTTTLTAKFCPNENLLLAKASNESCIWEQCALESKYGTNKVFEFKIRESHSPVPPIKIRLACGTLAAILDAINSRIASGTWNTIWERELVFDHLEPSATAHDVIYSKFTAIKGFDELKLVVSARESMPPDAQERIILGVRISVFFLSDKAKPSFEKPWEMKFTYIKLNVAKKHTVDRIERRSLSIQMSTEDVKKLTQKLKGDFEHFETLPRT